LIIPSGKSIKDELMADRSRRVAALIQQNVASILLEDFTRPQMQWITVTDCVMPRDLKVAKIYFSTIEQNLSHDEAAKILEDEKGKIKRLLAKKIRLRYMPDLIFVWDSTVLIDEKFKELKDGQQ
jgi:ribosome-binding factor A